MALAHGFGKLDKIYSGSSNIMFPDPLGIGSYGSLLIAGVSEFLFPLMVVVGLYTRWATLPVIGTMVVAFGMVHLNDPFQKQELSLVYLFAYLTIFLIGPGRLSIDSIFRGKN
jgi:putative oxidoreductase